MAVERSNKSMGYGIVYAGIALVLSGIPTTLELCIGFFTRVIGIDAPTIYSSEESLYVCMGMGGILIVFGCIIAEKMKTPVYVLNMFGDYKREVSNEIAEKTLKIADYKIKEQIIDIMPVFGDGTKIDNRANSYIVRQIKEEVQRFSNKTEGLISCFTGMAPIPYTILAGTYLSGTNVRRYFEYNRFYGDFYYELSNKKKKKWPELFELNSPPKTEDEDIVLAISVSCHINDEDLKIFNGYPVMHIGVSEPADCIIKSVNQLVDYKNHIYSYIDCEIKKKFKNVKRIHIVASIPSCLSVEIGKAIGAGQNRIPQIISYHYNSSIEKKYSFGIYVSGPLKGKIALLGDK